MIIEVDTTNRGTTEEPCFLVFPKYGTMPSQEVILSAKNEADAKAEVLARFGVSGVFRSDTARATKFFNDRHDARVAAGNQSLFKE